ncbi:MAG TPA: amino acid adenylation domain-containing protein [Pyrinomonadaceae bacterium]|nr:amino acid adenylation domain-containing protein [Pyrinomonadaceae bacterium]
MSVTPDAVTGLSPQAKRELLAELLLKKEKVRTPVESSREAELPQIVPDPQNRHEPFPLTDIQQAYWVGRNSGFELGGVGNHGYFELDCIDVDLERLNGSWNRTIERHDMMRAVILPDGRQVIQQDVPKYKFEISDLRGKPKDVVAAELDALRQRMSHNVFDPERWPLFEIRASILDDHLTRLHFSEDALHADMLSTAIILDDWLRFYENPALALPAPDLSFRDYVLTLEQVKKTDAYREALAYWRKRIESLPDGPELPRARAAGSEVQTRFKRRSVTIDATTWTRLKIRAAGAGITPSSLLLAVYAEVLGVWSSTTRFCLNVTIYNRLPLHPHVEQIVGDFTSMTFLVVDRTTVSPFGERARQLQKQLWTDLAFRHVSGVEVLRELARYRGEGSRAMMPVVFTGTLGTPGYRSLGRLGKMVYGVTQTPQVTIDQQVFEEDGALVLSWDAVEEVVPAGILDEMFAASSSLLMRLVTDDNSWESSRPIRVGFPAATEQAGPFPNSTLSALFSEQAARRPQQPAVIAHGRTLSYSDLENQANHVAAGLKRHGVGPGTLVGVVMKKGWEQVAGVLGILKAGAAYVPIDCRLPEARRRELITDAELRVVLTQADLEKQLSWPRPVAEFTVETVAWRDHVPEVIESETSPDQLAYVMYTSGSTGKPKGVMIGHDSVVNRMTDVVNRFGITGEDKALALTTLHHDLSVFDIFGMLSVAGGTIVLPDAERQLDPAHWLDLIEREQITVWNSVPAFMQMLVELVDFDGNRRATKLRLVMLSGDFIPVALPERIRALNDGLQVISLGGPTETTVWDICYPISEIDPGWTSIPYGRPLTNSHYYVLKDNLESCPTWVTGELCIAGVGLARGYWRDPEKTEKQFITHCETGKRLYRSGDLGRFLPDGNIEILGRSDFQVKIRGHRIELGEIESVLKQHPQVESAFATVHESNGSKQLIAYAVLRHADVDSGNGHSDWSRLEFRLQQPALRSYSDHLKLPLATPERTKEFVESHGRRRSEREFEANAVSLDQFSAFLGCLMQIEQEGSIWPKYRYPSAANLYPVQTYLYVKPDRVEGVAPGTYYYHPAEHALILLSPGTMIDKQVHGDPNQRIFESSAFSVFLIGDLSAVEPLYPEQARDFCLLEAGCMLQLMMTTAPDHDLGLCPIGGLDFAQIRSLFVPDQNQVLLHSICGGRPVKTRGENRTVSGDLQEFLRERLPAHMVPQNIVLLDRLPLTPNGKVDRRALPLVQSTTSREHLPPATNLERIIAGVWREVLGLDVVSVNRNLFELGATSIHIVQVRARLQKVIGRELPIADLFRHSTISSLAGFIGSDSDDGLLLNESQGRAQIRKSLRLRRSVKP